MFNIQSKTDTGNETEEEINESETEKNDENGNSQKWSLKADGENKQSMVESYHKSTIKAQ